MLRHWLHKHIRQIEGGLVVVGSGLAVSCYTVYTIKQKFNDYYEKRMLDGIRNLPDRCIIRYGEQHMRLVGVEVPQAPQAPQPLPRITSNTVNPVNCTLVAHAIIQRFIRFTRRIEQPLNGIKEVKHQLIKDPSDKVVKLELGFKHANASAGDNDPNMNYGFVVIKNNGKFMLLQSGYWSHTLKDNIDGGRIYVNKKDLCTLLDAYKGKQMPKRFLQTWDSVFSTANGKLPNGLQLNPNVKASYVPLDFRDKLRVLMS